MLRENSTFRDAVPALMLMQKRLLNLGGKWTFVYNKKTIEPRWHFSCCKIKWLLQDLIYYNEYEQKLDMNNEYSFSLYFDT